MSSTPISVALTQQKSGLVKQEPASPGKADVTITAVVGGAKPSLTPPLILPPPHSEEPPEKKSRVDADG